MANELAVGDIITFPSHAWVPPSLRFRVSATRYDNNGDLEISLAVAESKRDLKRKLREFASLQATDSAEK